MLLGDAKREQEVLGEVDAASLLFASFLPAPCNTQREPEISPDDGDLLWCGVVWWIPDDVRRIDPTVTSRIQRSGFTQGCVLLRGVRTCVFICIYNCITLAVRAN